MELINKDTVAHANLMLVHDLIWSKQEQMKLPVIYVYYTWSEEEKGEGCWVRYEREDGTSNTFGLNKKLTNILVKSPLVCMDLRIKDDLQSLALAKHEISREWLGHRGKGPMDSFIQADFWTIDSKLHLLSEKIARKVKEIVTLSKRLLPLTTDRVYDLYMTLNVNQEDLTKFSLRFDKIYPKLPDLKGDGEELEPIIIGIQKEFGLVPNDNPTFNKVLHQLKGFETLINKDIQQTLKAANLKGDALVHFEKEITSILMATSHYTGKVFGYDGQHGRELLEKVANDILEKLHHFRQGGGDPVKHYRDLALDINSWFVWEYPTDGSQPIRVTEPELDFYRLIMEGYTDSFVDQLAPVLVDSGHSDVIRPYKYHVKADPKDGRALGSMTRVVR